VHQPRCLPRPARTYQSTPSPALTLPPTASRTSEPEMSPASLPVMSLVASVVSNISLNVLQPTRYCFQLKALCRPVTTPTPEFTALPAAASAATDPGPPQLPERLVIELVPRCRSDTRTDGSECDHPSSRRPSWAP